MKENGNVLHINPIFSIELIVSLYLISMEKETSGMQFCKSENKGFSLEVPLSIHEEYAN